MLLLKTMSYEGLRGEAQVLPAAQACRGRRYEPTARLLSRLARTIDLARSPTMAKRFTEILLQAIISSAVAASHVALAIGSSLAAQFLAGCAAYACAMYLSRFLEAKPAGPTVPPPLPRRAVPISAGARVLALWGRIVEWRAQMRAAAELRELDDRSLRDIGLSRYDIDGIARGEFHLR